MENTSPKPDETLKNNPTIKLQRLENIEELQDAAENQEIIATHHLEPRYVVVPMDHVEPDMESEYRGNILRPLSQSMSDVMPDLELRDLIMKKKFGASPDRLVYLSFLSFLNSLKTCYLILYFMGGLLYG